MKYTSFFFLTESPYFSEEWQINVNLFKFQDHTSTQT